MVTTMPAFSSLPPDQEQEIQEFERRTQGVSKFAMTIGYGIALGFGFTIALLALTVPKKKEEPKLEEPPAEAAAKPAEEPAEESPPARRRRPRAPRLPRAPRRLPRAAARRRPP